MSSTTAPETIEKLCEPILQMNASSRIKAIELILHSIKKEIDEKQDKEPEVKRSGTSG